VTVRPAATLLDTRRSSLVWATGLITAVAMGLAIGAGQVAGAFLIVALLAAVLAPLLSLTSWCVLLLVTSVAGRGLVALFDLPALVSFFHYPVGAGLAVCVARRPATPASRRIGRWLIGLVTLLTVSMLANGSHPLRAMLFLVISGEPLLVLWAVVRWGPDAGTQRRVGLVALALLAIQVPLGLRQGMTLGWTDPVQGTLVGNGAGAHLLGGLFALGLLMAISASLGRRIPWSISLAVAVVAVGMMIASGANQVMIAVAVALATLPLTAWSPLRGRIRRPLLLGGAALALLVAATALVVMERTSHSGDILARAEGLCRPDHLPEVHLVRQRLSRQPLQLVLGSGPGTSASRASLLLTPQMLKESSPLAAFRLPPTEEALRIVSQVRASGGGSAEAIASGTLGVLGDLGLLGLAGLALIVAGLWRQARSWGGWLAVSARGALVMTTILLFVDNWLEYPEYAVPLALLLAFAMRQRSARTSP
jgi:hypothetical protein